MRLGWVAVVMGTVALSFSPAGPRRACAGASVSRTVAKKASRKTVFYAGFGVPKAAAPKKPNATYVPAAFLAQDAAGAAANLTRAQRRGGTVGAFAERPRAPNPAGGMGKTVKVR
ncbi:hypothetical protein M885DRAFT_517192 [Pelagophyceae sp. CCMP2097]|nr:hypothetical protein M885DRAFT_517192 [Pelagophyceae sp. CCMP2097]